MLKYIVKSEVLLPSLEMKIFHRIAVADKDLKQLNSCVSFCFAWRCVNMKN